MSVSTIILAGGKGTRFQKTGHVWIDKLLAEVDGKALIKWVFDSVKLVSDEVVISTNSFERGLRYRELLGDENVKIVVDEEKNCYGPLKGLASSISNVKGDKVLIVPGDMPFIKSDSLSKILDALNGYNVVVPLWFDGMTENLFFVAERKYLNYISNFLCRWGYWSPSGIIRASPSTYFMDVSKIVSDPKELININYYADLEDVKPRRDLLAGEDVIIRYESRFIAMEERPENLVKMLEKTDNVFLTAILYSYLALHRDKNFVLKAVKNFDIEARRYKEKHIYGLMALSFLDAGRVLKSAGYRLLANQYIEKAEEIFENLNKYPRRRIKI